MNKCILENYCIKNPLYDLKPNSIVQSGTVQQCFVCKLGRKFPTPLILCKLTSNYVKLSLDLLEYICLRCLTQKFCIPEKYLRVHRFEYKKMKIARENSRIFEETQTKEYREKLNAHPAICEFFKRYNSINDESLAAEATSIPPNLAKEALSAILIYKNDPWLLDALLWLMDMKKMGEIGAGTETNYFIARFSGRGGVWPTFLDRERVNTKMMEFSARKTPT